ncbi:MAG: DUF1499 domain-containing protein, partial [Myxococcota bacterium]
MSRAVAISSLVLLALGPLAAFLGVVPPLVGLIIFSLGGLAGLIAVLWGMIAWLRGRRRRDLITVAMGLPATVMMLLPLFSASSYPRINDITSDLDDPPALSQAPEYPDEFKPLVAAGYPDLKTLAVADAPAEIYKTALSLARARDDWTVTAVDEAGMTFEGTAETRLFRFKDDFRVRVRAAPDGAVVDMRSRSRDGKGDLGVNARRIREFFAALEAA